MYTPMIPGLAIQKALKYGALSNMKIDNMRLEHQEKLFKDAEKQKLHRGEAKDAGSTAERKMPDLLQSPSERA